MSQWICITRLTPSGARRMQDGANLFYGGSPVVCRGVYEVLDPSVPGGHVIIRDRNGERRCVGRWSAAGGAEIVDCDTHYGVSAEVCPAPRWVHLAAHVDPREGERRGEDVRRAVLGLLAEDAGGVIAEARQSCCLPEVQWWAGDQLRRLQGAPAGGHGAAVCEEAGCMLCNPPPALVVTRHPALVQYLRETGVVGPDVEVLAHVESPEQLRGRHVIGVLPMHLAAYAARITEVPMQLTPGDREAMQRGDLTLERVRQVAGAPQTYRVTRA